MFKRLLTIVGVIFLLTSCIPNKELIYFQGTPGITKDNRKLNDKPYKLKVHDVLKVVVKAKNEELVKMFEKEDNNNNDGGTRSGGRETLFNRNQLERGYSVERDGSIKLPYLGTINVLGYTADEVRTKVEERLLTYFNNLGDVFVTVQLLGIKYTIEGEILFPGPKVVNLNELTIIDAISYAGGVLNTGNRKDVEIFRITDTGTKKFTIDLTKIEAFSSEVFYLQPRDIIIIKPLKQKAWGTGITGFDSLATAVSAFSLVVSLILLSRNL